MMKISFEYGAQLKALAGQGSESIDFNSATQFQDALKQVAQKYSQEFQDLLLPGGELSPSILASVNDEQIYWEENPALNDGDTIALLAPMSGG